MPVSGGMVRAIGISLVGAFMAVQLVFLYSRYLEEHELRDYPRMNLPVAKNGKTCCYGVNYGSISWTQKGGWTVYGKGKISDQDLDQFLRDEVERHKGRGNLPGLRVRIPADAPAAVFVGLTKRMEQAGIYRVHVAVVERKFPSL